MDMPLKSVGKRVCIPNEFLPVSMKYKELDYNGRNT